MRLRATSEAITLASGCKSVSVVVAKIAVATPVPATRAAAAVNIFFIGGHSGQLLNVAHLKFPMGFRQKYDVVGALRKNFAVGMAPGGQLDLRDCWRYT